MEKIQDLTVNKLTIENTKELLPDKFSRYVMANAAQGRQSQSTYIVTAVKDVYPKANVRGSSKKKLVVKEVLEDGSEKNQISITLYKNYADTLDVIFKKHSSAKKQWLVFCNAVIVKYVGSGTVGWCPWSITAGYGDNKTSIWLLSETSTQSSNDDNRGILTASTKNVFPVIKQFFHLSQCTISGSNRYNVYVAVRELVKCPNETKNGNLHMMLGVVDPSSLTENGVIKDSLLQIFSGNSPEIRDVLESIVYGDIIRVRDMRMEIFNKSLRGKIYNAKQLVCFSGDIDDDVTPRTVCPSFILSEDEKEKVQSMRRWAKENLVAIQPDGDDETLEAARKEPETTETEGPIDPVLYNIKVSEIDEEKRFSLRCQVIKKQYLQNSESKMLRLRVTDGTFGVLHFLQLDFDEEVESFVDDVANKFTVDVLVMDNVLIVEDFDLGDFVILKHLNCCRVRPPSNEEGVDNVFQLILKRDDSEVQKLHPRDPFIKTILKDIARSSQQEESSEEDSVINLFLKAYGSPMIPKTPPKKSPNRINTQPLSPSRSANSKTPPRILTTPPRVEPNQKTTSEAISDPLRSSLSSSNILTSSPQLHIITDSLDSVLKNISMNCGQKPSTSKNDVENQAVQNSQGFSGSSEMEFLLNIPTSTQVSPSRNRIPNSESMRLIQNISPIHQPSSSLPEDNVAVSHQPPSDNQIEIVNRDTNEQGQQSLGIQRTSCRNTEEDRPVVYAVHGKESEEHLSLPSLTPSPTSHQVITDRLNAVEELPIPLSSLNTKDPSHQTPNAVSVNESHIIQQNICDYATKLKQGKTSEDVTQHIANMIKNLVEKVLTSDELKMFVERLCVSGNKKTEQQEEASSSGSPDPQEIKAKRKISYDEDLTDISTKSKYPKLNKGTRSPDKARNEELIVTEPSTSRGREVKNSRLPFKSSNEDKSPLQGRCDVQQERVRLTTQVDSEGVYSFLSNIREGKEKVIYIVSALVSNMGALTNKPCNAEICQEKVCFHDWVWGLCFTCGKNYESWELREQYSSKDLSKDRLRCNACVIEKLSSKVNDDEDEEIDEMPLRLRKNRAAKGLTKSPIKSATKNKKGSFSKQTVSDKRSEMPYTNSVASSEDSDLMLNVQFASVIPVIVSSLILKDADDGFTLTVNLNGDDAREFYGVEPSFKWLTGQANERITRVVSLLLRQRTPIWLGIQKYTLSNCSHHTYNLRHNSLIVVDRKCKN